MKLMQEISKILKQKIALQHQNVNQHTISTTSLPEFLSIQKPKYYKLEDWKMTKGEAYCF